MKRRRILQIGAVALASAALAGGVRYWPREGFLNSCPAEAMPDWLLQHDLVQQAWEGVNRNLFWDCHAHLVGFGLDAEDTWFDPDMRSVAHPLKYLQMQFYANAACVDLFSETVDQDYVTQLVRLNSQLGIGARLMLLAFDYTYSEKGERLLEQSAFYTSNRYALSIARQYPQHFEWIASIHPYRHDAVEALESAVANGARAVKWLPPVMGINPASPLCDNFYDAAVRLNIPLLVHADTERAVHGAGKQNFGNPLLLRRPLDRGAKVIVAHCASLGSSPDIDKKTNLKNRSNFELFARMMDEQQYCGLLYGDISAVTQVNRMGGALEELLRRKDWQSRLINGSDYFLPAVMPLFSLQRMRESGFLSAQQTDILVEIRRYNPLLFDFVCKRSLEIEGNSFDAAVFETRPKFEV